MKFKSIKRVFVVLLGILMICSSAFAHSGRTDGNGGHKDNKNKSGLGSYHYHCGGYPAHLHSGGVCPYKSTSSASSSSVEHKSKYTEKDKTFVISGVSETLNTITVNDTTLVELRGLCDTLGIAISYDAATRSIDCTKDDISFTLQIDSTNFWKNAERYTLDVAPIEYNGRTMIPARIVAEAIGNSVTYDSNSDSITIQ